MRKIEFRAISIASGEWIYGYLIELFTTAGQEPRYAIDMCRSYTADGISQSVFEVDPKTIGQYTGLNDFDGKPIFENDIVVASDPINPNERYCLQVKWTNTFDQAAFRLVDNENYWSDIQEYHVLVVGNVHENPELLKQKFPLK